MDKHHKLKEMAWPRFNINWTATVHLSLALAIIIFDAYKNIGISVAGYFLLGFAISKL